MALNISGGTSNSSKEREKNMHAAPVISLHLESTSTNAKEFGKTFV